MTHDCVVRCGVAFVRPGGKRTSLLLSADSCTYVLTPSIHYTYTTAGERRHPRAARGRLPARRRELRQALNECRQYYRTVGPSVHSCAGMMDDLGSGVGWGS